MPYYPHFQQRDSYDCGPTCLQMIAQFYGKKFDIEFLREKCFITRNGVSALGITEAAEFIGFKTLIVKTNIEILIEECPLPVILHWNQEHFIVLYKAKKNFFSFLNKHKKNYYLIADPAYNLQTIDEETLQKCWLSEDTKKGIAILLEPQAEFYNQKYFLKKTNIWQNIFKYIIPFKHKIFRIVLLLTLSVLISLCFPFLNQSLVDKGIVLKNYNLINLFIISQIVLFTADTIINLIRNRLLLNTNTKISLHIVSNFLKKLLQLPIRFFDSKSVGDVSQRIQDHQRIQDFLTGDFIQTSFAIIELIIYGALLFYYQINIGFIFVGIGIVSVLWIFRFQKKREQLDYIKFNQNKIYQDKLHEMIVGMQEIKLFGAENTKRWEWEFLQQRMYKLNVKSLILEQWQQTGFHFLSYLKNILISLITAYAVVNEQLSIGIMLSISYIIGVTNSPFEQLVSFFKSAQNAKMSFERMQEVENKMNEKEEVNNIVNEDIKNLIETTSSIEFKDVSFQYNGPHSKYALHDINLSISKNKITAIVGVSGSGKTTLLKLLLGFYKPTKGFIHLITNKSKKIDISNIEPSIWRSICGTVMQDSYVFYDTIEKNICLDGKEINKNQFKMACNISNVEAFVKELPNEYKTLIGSNGTGLSGGQKQRILIARAVYKNPQFIFFDEATSSLDANNEQQIMQQLLSYFKNKTVLIIAHRLSTVKNADEIIVLEKGQIIERGNHHQLVQLQGNYFNLVKNQLALGND